jgi:hypothetical protein
MQPIISLVDPNNEYRPRSLTEAQAKRLVRGGFTYICPHCTQNAQDYAPVYHPVANLDAIGNPDLYLDSLVIVAQGPNEERAKTQELIDADTIPEQMTVDEMLAEAHHMLEQYINEEDADLTAVDTAMQYIERAREKSKRQATPGYKVMGSKNGRA